MQGEYRDAKHAQRSQGQQDTMLCYHIWVLYEAVNKLAAERAGATLTLIACRGEGSEYGHGIDEPVRCSLQYELFMYKYSRPDFKESSCLWQSDAFLESTHQDTLLRLPICLLTRITALHNIPPATFLRPEQKITPTVNPKLMSKEGRAPYATLLPERYWAHCVFCFRTLLNLVSTTLRS